MFEICLASLNSKIEIYLVSKHCNGNLPFSTRYLLDMISFGKWSIFHSYFCLPECSHSSSLLKSTQSNIFGTTYCTILQMLDTWLVGQIINTHHNTHLPMPTYTTLFLNRGILFKMQLRHDQFDPQIALLVDVSVPRGWKGTIPKQDVVVIRTRSMHLNVLHLHNIYIYLDK